MTEMVSAFHTPRQATSKEWTKPIWYRIAPSTAPTATAMFRRILKLIRTMITIKMIASLMRSIDLFRTPLALLFLGQRPSMMFRISRSV